MKASIHIFIRIFMNEFIQNNFEFVWFEIRVLNRKSDIIMLWPHNFREKFRKFLFSEKFLRTNRHHIFPWHKQRHLEKNYKKAWIMNKLFFRQTAKKYWIYLHLIQLHHHFGACNCTKLENCRRENIREILHYLIIL